MDLSHNEKKRASGAGCSFAYVAQQKQCTGIVRIIAPSCDLWLLDKLEFVELSISYPMYLISSILFSISPVSLKPIERYRCFALSFPNATPV